MVANVLATTLPVLHTSIAHVTKPSTTNAHTHTQYLIRVSDERAPGLNWTVYRRYSEFRAFRIKLDEAVKARDMCTHCAVMSKRSCFMQFPHRKVFGNFSENTLESRRVGLNYFLDAVVKHARTCKESMTCQTRPLMNQFLMVNDMRYTFLNVNMGDQEEDFHGKTSSSDLNCFGQRSSSFRSSRSDSICATPLSSTAPPKLPMTFAQQLEAQDAPKEQTGNQQEHETPLTAEQEGHGLTHKRKTMPNLLAYSTDRRTRGSRTNSWNEDEHHKSSTVAPPLRGSLCDWDTAKYQTSSSSSNGRHSDPGGASRSDLLNFSRGSFSGGRSDHRTRARKVHLSSAAKRVKKLEEQEARFSDAQYGRPKRKRPVLETIYEE